MPGPLIEWGAAAAALPGQAVSGDRFVVAPFPDGALVAVADGLGHGADAAAAADIAVNILQAHAAEAVISLVRRCHDALARTRGVVLTLASFNAADDSMTWLGVGNAEGVLLRGPTASGRPASPRETALLRAGVVGYQLPPLRASVLPVAPGDTLILTSDGIHSGFAVAVTPTDSPQQIADRILGQYNRQTDDAIVLVVRYLGGAP
jgi:serine/threonine protein phosphatase PrpC